MATPNKDTVYIDIDDEITGIIDKVQASSGKVVALVLPKRAAVFQSIVNMKLLKRSADEAKKNLVLITAEAGLLPLAGAVGIHVAKSLQSKPEVPVAPDNDDKEETVAETPEDESEINFRAAEDKPIGEVAGLPATDEVETVELEDEEPSDTTKGIPAIGKKLKSAKDKKLKIPNFDRFRLMLALGGLLLVLLIVGIVLALSVLPKAAITIKTNASNVNTNIGFTLDTKTASFNEAQNILPAKLVQQQKTYTQQAPATGQQNKGEKATGNVSMTAKECGTPTSPANVPAGTGVSANGLTYITLEETSFSFDKIQSGCIYFNGNSDTSVIAQRPGSQYNIGASNFSVAGRADASGTGSASGGTDNIVKVVSQGDIDGAKQKINTQDNAVKNDLAKQLKKADYFAITITFAPGTPNVTTTANVGDAVDNVTVNEVVTYTMFGAHEKDIKKLLDNNIKGQINTAKQSILDEGLDSSADFSVSNASATGAQINLQTVATAGPDLDVDALKKQVAGKKSGNIKSLLQNNPGVTDVTVKLSPFWVSSAPKKTSKITITIAKPTPAPNEGTP